jgi:hypothetical protein
MAKPISNHFQEEAVFLYEKDAIETFSKYEYLR